MTSTNTLIFVVFLTFLLGMKKNILPPSLTTSYGIATCIYYMKSEGLGVHQWGGKTVR